MDVKDNTKHKSRFAEVGAQAALAVAWVSGLFSLVLCVIVIVNQINVSTVDPLDDKSLAALRGAIAKDLENRELRDSVRSLTMMAQRAFFTSQTQMRVGGLLLLGGVAIFLAAIKTLVELKKKNPAPVGGIPYEGGSAERAAARWAVAAGGGVLVVVALTIVLISEPPVDLGEEASAMKGSAAAAPESKPAEAPKEPPASAPVSAPAVPAGATAGGAKAIEGVKDVPAKAWPQFRGPNGMGVAHHKSAPVSWNGTTQEGLLWAKPVPMPGTNSPIVWDGKVFVSGSDEKKLQVYAFDADKGELLWTGEVPNSAPAPVKLIDGNSYASSTLATDGLRVYAIFATGDVAAFTLDGKRLWASSLGVQKNQYGYASSLATHGGRLLVQYDDEKAGRFLGFDGATGKPAWDVKRTLTYPSWATPALLEGAKTEVVLVAKPVVTGHDPKTGQELWSVNCMDGEPAPSAAAAGGRIFVGTDHHAMLGIEGGKVIWKYEEDIPDASSPVATETRVYMASSGGVITCLDAKTGKKVWSNDSFEEGFYGSLILVDDRIYVVDRAGTTHVFKASDKWEPLATNPLGEKTDCTPAIPEGRIYLRSAKTLYCVGKSGT